MKCLCEEFFNNKWFAEFTRKCTLIFKRFQKFNSASWGYYTISYRYQYMPKRLLSSDCLDLHSLGIVSIFMQTYVEVPCYKYYTQLQLFALSFIQFFKHKPARILKDTCNWHDILFNQFILCCKILLACLC